LARRLVPRFTRGIAVLLFYFVWRLEVRRLLPRFHEGKGFLKPDLFTRRCGVFRSADLVLPGSVLHTR
jgi:hypothetical protein